VPVGVEGEMIERMMTAPSAGPLPSLALRASLDDAERFERSAEVGPYLGLTPSRWQSGALDRRADITKQGNGLCWPISTRPRRRCWNVKSVTARCDAGPRAAGPPGQAPHPGRVARKLAVLMHKLWRSG